MAYIDIFAAVVGLMKSDAGCVSALPGGVHAGRAPTGSLALGPFAVATEVGSSPSFTAGANATRIDDGSIQVSCFATSRNAAVAAGNAIEAAITDAVPTLTEGVAVHLRQTDRRCEIDPDPGPGGSVVWQEIREFRFITAKEI